jgi:hypothetical protein
VSRRAADVLPEKHGCTAPALGRRVTLAPGDVADTESAEHLRSCPACRLEQEVHAGLDRHAMEPTRALVARLRWAVHRGSSGADGHGR